MRGKDAKRRQARNSRTLMKEWPRCLKPSVPGEMPEHLACTHPKRLSGQSRIFVQLPDTLLAALALTHQRLFVESVFPGSLRIPVLFAFESIRPAGKRQISGPPLFLGAIFVSGHSAFSSAHILSSSSCRARESFVSAPDRNGLPVSLIALLLESAARAPSALAVSVHIYPPCE